MPADRFVHLHLHTHYSLLDGATRIGDLIDRCKTLDMPAVAITDHGNMFGAIEFYSAAIAAGIKPIIGCEFYIAPGDRRSKDARGMKEASYHLLILAQNLTGYRNLMKLSSIAYREGFYYRPRIDKEVLREFSDGLLCTSTCLGGEIPQTFIKRDRAAAEELAKEYLSIFGPERFFIELQDHGIAEQKMLNPELADLAKRLGVATIATNDVHYLNADDAEAHDVLCCISTGKLVSDEDRFKFANDQFYLKTPDEMSQLFADYPDAISNTVRVADMCDLELDFSTRHAPVYKVAESTTPDAELRRLVYEGAERRYEAITDELRERIDYELEVIASKGFSSYFLIVWDFVHFARDNGIPVGARGSGCSSVVSYCLYISAPDPLRYGLYFERFMDPDRDEMPDIDVDICQVGRSRVIEYVRQKYGDVAQIITFNKLKARAAVKDVSRVMGIGFEEANKLTQLIPNELKMTIDKALEAEPELRNRYETDPQVARVIDIAKKLEGLSRNAGVHAAGVVVADCPLDDLVPLYKAPNDDQICTQYDGNVVEKVGLLKIDFLGLRTLTTLERARQLVGRTSGTDLDIEHLDLTDQNVFGLFCRGETKGIFQFESGGMRDVIMKMGPNRIEDLIAANALYRPGPMEYIGPYIARKHGQNWTTPHPVMTEVLEETFGIMVYQEQVSRLVNRLGGIELKRAFRLAKVISKKKTAQIEAEREPFLAGCTANGVDRDTAEKIFADILKFGGYAFNKAHSTGYALVAFQTAFMKVYHPVEFMAALMTFEMSNTDKINDYFEECRRMDITVLPPDVNSSDNDFTVTTQGPGSKPVVRFGLGAVKGIGQKAIDAISVQREDNGPFENLYDFCERVDLSAVNRSVIESLIDCGAFDTTGAMRKALIQVLDMAIENGARVQKDRREGQLGLFGEAPADDAADALQRKLSTAEWTESEMLVREKAALGFYVTAHPLTTSKDLIRACSSATTASLDRFSDGQEVIVGGMVSAFRTITTKRGKNPGSKMGIATLEDLEGSVEVIIFNDQLEDNRPLLKPDALVFVRAEVDRKREDPCLRVTEVVPANQAWKHFAEYVILNLDRVQSDHDALNQLLELCQAHKGTKALYLSLTTADDVRVTINTGPELRIEIDQPFIEAATGLLGPNQIVVRNKQRKAIPLAGASVLTSSAPKAAPQAQAVVPA